MQSLLRCVRASPLIIMMAMAVIITMQTMAMAVIITMQTMPLLTAPSGCAVYSNAIQAGLAAAMPERSALLDPTARTAG